MFLYMNFDHKIGCTHASQYVSSICRKRLNDTLGVF